MYTIEQMWDEDTWVHLPEEWKTRFPLEFLNMLFSDLMWKNSEDREDFLNEIQLNMKGYPTAVQEWLCESYPGLEMVEVGDDIEYLDANALPDGVTTELVDIINELEEFEGSQEEFTEHLQRELAGMSLENQLGVIRYYKKHHRLHVVENRNDKQEGDIPLGDGRLCYRPIKPEKKFSVPGLQFTQEMIQSARK